MIDMCPEVLLAVLMGASKTVVKENTQMGCVLVFTSTFKASQFESLNIKASQIK